MAGNKVAGADDNQVVKIVYTFFLGALLALFVGLGVQTFYPGPEMPEYPTELQVVPGEGTPTAEQQRMQREYAEQSERWQEDQNVYDRNVGVISLAASVVLLALSLVLEKRNKVLTNGIMLGGLFTLFYAIGRSVASEETAMSFAAVAVGLAVVLFLGWRRFFQDRQELPPGPAPGAAPRETTGV